MPSFLTIDSLCLSTPDGRALAIDLTLAFGAECTGIIGRNGAGKSTLLRVLAGLAEPFAGKIARVGTIALFQQHWPDETLSVAEAIGVAAALARLDRLAAGKGTACDAADADWTLEDRLDDAFNLSGLDRAVLPRTLATLSGGERTRLAVAKAILAAPDMLLLDEPTNNLDVKGRALIARLIANWRGGVVVASHDRALLEGVDRIVALSAMGCTVFGGGWSAYVDARDAARDRAVADLTRAEGALRRTEGAMQRQREHKARRDKAGRAWRATGSEDKMILDAAKGRAERTAGRDAHLADRLIDGARRQADGARRAIEILTPLTIALPPSGLSSDRDLVRFEDAAVRVEGRVILSPLRFTICGPERVALTGRNGAGKTTVLKLITGALTPTRGTVWALRDRIALLDQHVAMLDGAASLIDNLRRLNPALSANDAHAALARFAFRNQAADRRIDTLSGGERLRAGLACALSGAMPPLMLALDEPTNHLDIESTEILERALAAFDGALMVVSHDAAFLTAIGITREIALPLPHQAEREQQRKEEK